MEDFMTWISRIDIHGHHIVITVVAALCMYLAAIPALADIQLKPGVIAGKQVYISKARNYAYCEIAPVVGTQPKVVAQFYNTTGASNCPLDKFVAIDTKKLAADLKADMVYINPTPQTARRHWVMDKLWVYRAGETVDFYGVKATWVAAMSPENMKAGIKGDYTPMQIHRETQYLYAKGSKVFLIRTPRGKTYVMQSYATEVDTSLTFNQLPQLKSKLNLPQGWKFEVKELTKDLTVDPRKAKGVAHIIRDDLHNVYEGCSFDAACNYVP